MSYKHTFFYVSISISVSLLGATALPSQATVVASLKPVGFIAAAIADGVTKTQVLLNDGASEHDYCLRPSDITCLKNADLVVWIAPEMEVFMDKTTRTFIESKKIIISKLDGVKPLLIKGTNDNNFAGRKNNVAQHRGEYNMHLWLSPEIARLSAVAIYDRLVKLMPQSRAKLDANLRDFEAQLAATDKQISRKLAPLKNKGYFVFHDAYVYYEKYYGLTSLGYFTMNPEIQPGAGRLHKIRTRLLKQKATCIFSEPQFRPTVVEAVSRKTAVRIGTLDPLGMGIPLSKTSYATFLTQLTKQYSSCLQGD